MWCVNMHVCACVYMCTCVHRYEISYRSKFIIYAKKRRNIMFHTVYINGIQYILLIYLSSISDPILFQGTNESHSLLAPLSLTTIENKSLNFTWTKPQGKNTNNHYLSGLWSQILFLLKKKNFNHFSLICFVRHYFQTSLKLCPQSQCFCLI